MTVAGIAVMAALVAGPGSASADMTIGGPPPEVRSGAALFQAVSRDGRRVVFSSRRPLAQGDRDRSLDVYVRAGNRTILLSTGGGSGEAGERVSFEAATPDARTVLFRTEDSLTATDDDSSWDLYRRGPGGIDLVSAGVQQVAGDAPRSGTIPADGERVFFSTTDPLIPEDEDEQGDIYEFRAGEVRLVSVGVADDARLLAAAADGSRVVFSTHTALVASDSDDQEDIYERRAGATTLLSPGGGPASCPAEPGLSTCPVEFTAASADASRVFFETRDRLLPDDADRSPDVYAYGPEGLELISTGPSDSHSYPASLAAITPDGSRAYFVSGETFGSLSGDVHCALFERRGQHTSLVSHGRRGAVSLGCGSEGEAVPSQDGSVVVFVSRGLSTVDSSATIYRRARGRTKIVVAPRRMRRPLGAFLMSVSTDGSRVAFLTARPLLKADRDGGYDLYSRGPRGLKLLTLGPAGGNAPHAGPPGSLDGSVFPQFGGASANGRRVFFSTEERLLRRDRNRVADLYESGPQGLKLVSTRSRR
jgi:hypothetical protein